MRKLLCYHIHDWNIFYKADEKAVDRVREGMEKAKRFGTKSGIAIGRPPMQLPKDTTSSGNRIR